MARKKISKVPGNRKANIILQHHVKQLHKMCGDFATMVGVFCDEMIEQAPHAGEQCGLCTMDDDKHNEDCPFEMAAELNKAVEATFKALGVEVKDE
jgi:hypothetical protein